MSRNELAAKRYARGLVEAAREHDAVARVREDVKWAADLVDGRAGERHAPELLEFLESPAIAPRDKQDAARRILSRAGTDETVMNLFGVLIEKGRVALLPAIARVYAEQAVGAAGERAAVVQTAMPLTEAQTARLAEALSAAFGGVVTVHQEVEPGLLAGAKITVDGKTIDGSVLGRLEEMRRRLIAKGREASGDTGADDAE